MTLCFRLLDLIGHRWKNPAQYRNLRDEWLLEVYDREIGHNLEELNGEFIDDHLTDCEISKNADGTFTILVYNDGILLREYTSPNEKGRCYFDPFERIIVNESQMTAWMEYIWEHRAEIFSKEET